jgi:hypothetical protein
VLTIRSATISVCGASRTAGRSTAATGCRQHLSCLTAHLTCTTNGRC